MALLECHDNAIRRQGNAIRHLTDGQSQLSNILMMRALFNQFTDKRYRKGPFVLTLTNLTTHNIMVDRHGHITSLINLNWACSLPVEMLTAPYWLVDLAADDIDYANLINDFLDSLRAREKVFPDYHHDSNAAVMRSCLESGTFWYLRTLTSPDRVCQLFRQHIQGRYSVEDCNHPAFERLAVGIGAKRLRDSFEGGFKTGMHTAGDKGHFISLIVWARPDGDVRRQFYETYVHGTPREAAGMM